MANISITRAIDAHLESRRSGQIIFGCGTHQNLRPQIVIYSAGVTSALGVPKWTCYIIGRASTDAP